jgi:hypothetical protein
MNSKEILSAIKFPVGVVTKLSNSGYTVCHVVDAGGKELFSFYESSALGFGREETKNLIAAAINSLQEREDQYLSALVVAKSMTEHMEQEERNEWFDHEINLRQSVTICNELGDKPKSAQEETNQDELWREAIKEANDFALSGKWKQQAGYIPFVAEYAEAKDEYLKINYIIKRK